MTRIPTEWFIMYQSARVVFLGTINELNVEISRLDGVRDGMYVLKVLGITYGKETDMRTLKRWHFRLSLVLDPE